jgi:outer membrane protein, heavy metal efflux system
MRTSWANGIAAALFGASLASASGLSLDSLIRMALSRNADLKAAQAQVDGLSEDTAASAYRSNPSLGLEAFHNPGSPGEPKASVRLTQEFRFGYPGQATGQAKARAAAGEQGRKAMELDLIEAIRNGYQAWQILNRKAALQAETESRWRNLSRLAAAKVAEGRLSQVEEAQTRLNLAKAQQRRAGFRAEMAAQEQRLGHWAGAVPLPDSLRSEFPDSLPAWPSVDSLAAWAAALNPDAIASEKEIAVAKSQVALEEALRKPSLALSAGYDREADGANLVGAGVEVPIPVFNRNRAGIAKARASLREAEWKREAALLKLRAGLLEAEAQLRSLADRYRAYQGEVRDLSRKQVALSEKGFREGLLGVFELSRVEEEALNQDLEALDILDAFNRTWNRLGRLVGGKTWQ